MKTAKAAEDALAGVRVYVIGGIAEGKATVFSDIGTLIVAKEILRDKKRLYIEILERRSISMGYLGTSRSNSI